MTALFASDLTGDGLTLATAYAYPGALYGDPFLVELCKATVLRKKGKGAAQTATQMKGLFLHPNNVLTAPGLVRIEQAASGAALVTKMKATAVTGQIRTFLRGFATANGWPQFREDSLWNALVDLLTIVEEAMVPILEQTFTSVN